MKTAFAIATLILILPLANAADKKIDFDWSTGTLVAGWWRRRGAGMAWTAERRVHAEPISRSADLSENENP